MADTLCSYVYTSVYKPDSAIQCGKVATHENFCAKHHPEEMKKQAQNVKNAKAVTRARENYDKVCLEIGSLVANNDALLSVATRNDDSDLYARLHKARASLKRATRKLGRER